MPGRKRKKRRYVETEELLVSFKKTLDKAWDTIFERRKRAKNSERIRAKRRYVIFYIV